MSDLHIWKDGMGSSISCFRPSSSSQRLPKEEDSDDQNSGLATSIIKFVKLKCLWIDEDKEQMQLRSQQDEEQRQQLINNTKSRTLEEWLLASPYLNKKDCGNIGGEYYVLKSVSPNVHVHSSLYGDNKENISQSLERLLKLDEVGKEELSRSQNGKSKKKGQLQIT